MDYAEKVVEIMKTRKGKLFTLLLVLTVIFTFTGIAYGTSESVKANDSVMLSEEQESAAIGDGIVASDEADNIVAEDPSEDLIVDGEENEDGATKDEKAEEVAPVPTVVTDGVVTFDVKNAEVASGGKAVTSVIVDPATISKNTPFTFSVAPIEGYEVVKVSATSTFNDRAKPSVPATPIEGVTEPEKTSMGGGTPYEDLSDDLKAVLEDTADKSIEAIDPEVSDDPADAASVYSIDDMAFFAGRDITITIETQEIQYDAWYKVVDALALGHSVKLTQDIKIGSQATNTELNSLQQKSDKSQAVVRPNSDDPAKTVTLNLNGCSITAPGEGLDGGVNSIISVRDGAKFEIIDTATAVPAITPGTVTALKLNGENGANKDLVGKTGYFDGDKFIYFVTTSSANNSGATSETTHEQIVAIPGSDKKVGRIIASSSIENLVEVTAGSDLKISGGIYTNTKGRALKNSGGNLDMQGGIIIKCSPDQLSGAGVYSEGGTTNISGNSAIIGNSVNGPGSNWNGGGVSLKGGTLNISDQALIAGNKVNGEHSSPDVRNYNPDGTGGGIYAQGGTINLSGSCRIAGNEAKYFGGGINAKLTNINISEDAIVTNNKTAFFNQAEQDNKNWQFKTTGGGGIHICTDTASFNALNLNGGNITANYSADGGGGILVPNVGTTFTMGVNSGYTPVVASNYAATSEGGGLYLRASKSSVISTGYITNNATETPYDFGGGGLYVANEAEGIEVQYPVVTANTAQGFGGGVANCQNGITVTEKAAIFANTAYGNKTSNSSVEVDHWMKDKLNIDVSMAQDFVGGKKSDIYSNMLGGGYYNWTGYMSYQPPAVNVEVIQKSWSDNVIKVNGSTLASNFGGGLTHQNNTYYQITVPTNKLTEENVEKFVNALEGGVITVSRSNKTEIPTTTGFSSNYLGEKVDKKDEFNRLGNPSYARIVSDGAEFWYITFTIDNESYKKWDGYTKNIWSKQPTSTADANDGEWKDRDRLYIPEIIGEDGEVESWRSTTNGITPYEILEAAKTITAKTALGYELVKWPIAQIDFPQNQNALARANRFMCLTANVAPDSSEAKKAINTGSLFITGNYSNTNGGGIANNGNIVIGENPNDPYTPPPSSVEYENGQLVVSKAFIGDFDSANSGSANATFRITQYASLEDVGKTALKEDVVTLAFTAAGSATYTWPEEVRAGNYFVIEELDIEGDNGVLVEPLINDRKLVLPVEYVLDHEEIIVDDDGNQITKKFYIASLSAEFKNTFSSESYMTSVINKYMKSEDGNYAFEQTFVPAKANSGNDQPENN